MIIENLKARVLRALGSLPAAASVHGHGDDDDDDDASFFFDAREAEPLDAWELVGGADPPPPPVPASAVVLYTTTLRGVRRTFEDCGGVRALLERLGVAFQERDVSMDRGLRDELRGLAGEGAVPPRLFVRGRDLGGAAQVLALHEEGRLLPLLPAPDKTKQQQRQQRDATAACSACAGLRFLVCGECDGSRKVFDGGRRAARCRGCNENGLVMCPLCF